MGRERGGERERERERDGIKGSGGKIQRLIKMEKRISFLQTPFVLLQKHTPIFWKQKGGFLSPYIM
jgi:hypothetical protein